MAKDITANQRREAELLQAVLRLIDKNGSEMRYQEIKNEFPNHFHLTDKERSKNNTWEESWHSVLGMVGGIELKQVGLVDINKSNWSLTPEGRKTLQLPVEEFFRAYHYKWRELAKMKALKGNTLAKIDENLEINLLEKAKDDIDILQQQARDGMRKYLTSKDPFEFQRFVAALLRGMGLFTPWVADKGKDGGVDIIAYETPLGVSGSHVKVQVKHYPQTPVSVDVIRELIGKMNKTTDVGIVVTSGHFTNESHREARYAHRHICLLEMDDLIDLWLEYYPKMKEEDKAELPLVPIYFVNTEV